MARWMKCPLPPCLDPPAWTPSPSPWPGPPCLDPPQACMTCGRQGGQERIDDITGKGLLTAVALSTASCSVQAPPALTTPGTQRVTLPVCHQPEMDADCIDTILSHCLGGSTGPRATLTSEKSPTPCLCACFTKPSLFCGFFFQGWNLPPPPRKMFEPPGSRPWIRWRHFAQDLQTSDLISHCTHQSISLSAQTPLTGNL